MTTLTDLQAEGLGGIISNAIDNNGFIVKVKTDVSPEVEVYNSETQGQGANLSFIVPKSGITIYNKYGKTLATYGGKPKLNPVKVSIIYGTLGFSLFLMYRGIRSFIK